MVNNNTNDTINNPQKAEGERKAYAHIKDKVFRSSKIPHFSTFQN